MTSRYYSLLIVLFIIFCGCSSRTYKYLQQPVFPNPDDFSEANFVEGHDILLAGTMVIDPVNMSVDIIEREISAHFNITGLLASGCPGGCFKFSILSYVNEEMTLRLQITNPSSIQAYDVRIIFTNLYGKKVLNPDNYTNLFDPAGGMPFNPMIAFYKESDTRAFPIGPAVTDDETLILKFPNGANPNVNFIISAAYPSQCNEPFEMYDVNLTGELTESGGSAQLSVGVKDHQNDISWVAADTSIFTGGITFFQYNQPSDRWIGTFSNALMAPAGNYTLYFAAASPNSGNINIYDSITITVSSGTLSFETPRAIDDYSYPANPYTISQGGKALRVDDDYVYMIYYIDDQLMNQQIDLLRSDNGGDSFYQPVRVNTDDPLSIHISPALDVSPDGTLHAAWIRGDLSGFVSNMEYAKSTNHGESFSSDVNIGGMFFELWCDIAAFGNNEIFAIRNGAPGGVFNIFFNSSMDGGSSWQIDENMSYKMWGGAPFSDLFPVMDVDTLGNIYVIFESDASPDKQDEYNMYVTKSSDKGVHFSFPTKVCDLTGRKRLPNIACDKNNRIHVLWVYLDSGTEGDIRYSYSDDGGATYSPSVEVDDLTTSCNEPIIAIDPNTNMLYVAYVGGGNLMINRSTDGVNWGASVDVSGGYATGPNIDVDNNSRVHLAWADGGRIYYTRSIK